MYLADGRYTPVGLLFFFNDTATTEIYTLSLHDALPIFRKVSNIDQRVTMLSRHTAPITAPFRHPSVTESSVALPPIQREPSVARSTHARFTASRRSPASLSQMPVAHGDPAYCLSTVRVR